MSEALVNTIIGTILGAIATSLIGIVAYMYKSRQGNRIIVRRISQTPQIKISEEVRKNLKITYNDQPVDNLVLNNLVIFNNGDEIIEPVEIKLGVTTEDETAFDYFDYLEREDPLGITEIKGPAVSEKESRYVIKRPYLNPKKKFKEEEIKFAVFSNTTLSFSVEGGGRGWYAKFEEGSSGGRYLKMVMIMMLIILVISIAISLGVRPLPSPYSVLCSCSCSGWTGRLENVKSPLSWT